MSLDIGIVYQLWNDRVGPDNLFDRAGGEVGLDHITIPAVTGPLRQLRCVGQADWRWFQTEGGWHCRSDAKHYHNTRLRPKAAKWLGSRDVAAQLCERAHGRNIDVIFRVEPRGVAHLLEQHAQIRMKNAWGDETPASGACPSNPDLRELFRATLEELTAYGPAGFEIGGWTVDHSVDAGQARIWGWNPAARELLDICFCESCRQIAIRADVDADLAARSVRVHFDRLALHSAVSETDATVEGDEVLRDYRAARTDDLSAWLARLAEQHARLKRFRLAEVSARGEESRADPGWSHLGRPADPPQLESSVAEFLRKSGAPSALSLPVWRPHFAEAGDLVRLVNDSKNAGASFFDFEGLHEAPPDALVWLRQAVRFARRA